MDFFCGEIRMFGFNFNPAGGNPNGHPAWAFCNGQTVPASQFQILTYVIGNTFGGDSSNIALPNLQGQVPVGTTGTRTIPSLGHGHDHRTGILGEEDDTSASEFPLARAAGAATVTIDTVPAHTHAVGGQYARDLHTGMTPTPSSATRLSRLTVFNSSLNKYLGNPTYSTTPSAGSTLHAATISTVGGSGGKAQAHENRQPYQVVNFCIAVAGLFPPRPS